MQVISVVRNFEMYEKLVRNNVYMQGATFTVFDNRNENLYITTRYNQFLKNYDYNQDDWFVFCHEDWEVKENLAARLENLDKNSLYGPIGVPLITWIQPHTAKGMICESDKEGNQVRKIGTLVSTGTEVGTFDCQCLIVHSSLVKQYQLCFDEQFFFDLYVEDFCMNAREFYNISSRILQIDCQHYSRGSITERFYMQFDLLCKKYFNAKFLYGTTVGRMLIGDKACLCGKKAKKNNKIFRFFYLHECNRAGKMRLKICKIPLPIHWFTKEK